MIWDPCLARAVAGELRDRLSGSRARASLFERRAARVVLFFREATLIVDLAPGRGTLALEPAAEPTEDARPLPARLVSVEAVPDERILVLRFKRVRGRKADPTLILELATNRQTAIWADGADLRVRAQLSTSKVRHAVGQPWQPPSGEPRAGLDGDLSFEAWTSRIGDDPDNARKSLVRSIAHTSALNAPLLVGEAVDRRVGYQRWTEMATDQHKSPCLVLRKGTLQPYPWPIEGDDPAEYDSVLDAMAEAASRGHGSGWIPDDVVQHLDDEEERLTRRLDALGRELDNASAADELRADATLILSSLHAIAPGSSDVTLIDFEGNERQVRLDPTAKPQEYAERLFDKATRLERAAAQLPREVRRAEEALQAIVELREQVLAGQLSADEVHVPDRAAGPSAPVADRPYRRYVSSGGIEIRVGRSAKANDLLTFGHARGSDVWLHARQASGAHVVLRWNKDDNPPARDLEEAAILAATFSRARGSAHVPVAWTRRKYVRKPRGARPGTVTMERAKTLFVGPDESLAKALEAP